MVHYGRNKQSNMLFEHIFIYLLHLDGVRVDEDKDGGREGLEVENRFREGVEGDKEEEWRWKGGADSFSGQI